MGTVPTTPFLPAGHLATQADMQQISDAAAWLLSGKPFCSVQASTTQSLTSSVRNLIKMQNKLNDTDGIFNSGGNPPCIIQTTGWYRCKFFVPLASSNSDCGILVTTGSGNPQGSGVANYCWPSGAAVDGASSYIAASGGGVIPYYLYPTDTIQIGLTPNGNVSTVTSDAAASMSLEWIAS